MIRLGVYLGRFVNSRIVSSLQSFHSPLWPLFPSTWRRHCSCILGSTSPLALETSCRTGKAKERGLIALSVVHKYTIQSWMRCKLPEHRRFGQPCLGARSWPSSLRHASSQPGDEGASIAHSHPPRRDDSSSSIANNAMLRTRPREDRRRHGGAFVASPADHRGTG